MMASLSIKPECVKRIPLIGVFPEIQLLGKNVYAILEDDRNIIDLLIWKTVVNAANGGNESCLISTSSLSASLLRSGLSGDAHQEITAQRLAVLELEPGSKALTSENTYRHLIGYIQAWRRGKHGLLIVNGAEKLFPCVDERRLLEWRHWAESQGDAIGLVFKRYGVDGDDVFTTIHRLAHLFAGIGYVTQKSGVPQWETCHWFGPAGLSVAKSYALRRTLDHQLEVIPEVTNGALKVLEMTPTGENRPVLVESTVFRPSEQPIKNWQVLDGSTEQHVDKLERMAGATVVLAFTESTNFDVLLRCVFSLRKRCDAHLKIVVREVNLALRHSQEAWLIHLGANLIVPMEVGYARFLSLTLLVYGQKVEHDLPSALERTAAISPFGDQLGYLPPDQFIAAVKGSISRSRAARVQNALLRLCPVEGLLLVQILGECTIKRTGDFISADDRCLYLLLPGCMPVNIEKTVDRIFPLPASQLFVREEMFSNVAGMQVAISDFEAQHRVTPFADLADRLAPYRHEASLPPTTPVVVEDKGPVAQRFEPPQPATRRHLFVKRPRPNADLTVIRPWDTG